MGMEGPQETKSNFKDVKIEGIVKRALETAQNEGEQGLPQLLQAIEDAKTSQDPVALDALDPDSQRNQKNLSEFARNALKKAWEMSETG